MSLISGTPTNAYILKSLVSTNKISDAEATHYLYFTYFSNPLFLVLMLSQIFTVTSVFKIILIHYLSNIIIAFIMRNKSPNISTNIILPTKINIGSTIISSINKSINTLLMILGTIVFYSILIFIFTSFFSDNFLFKTLISGLLELTNGLNNLSNLLISNKLKEISAVSIISFAGLSIHTQIKSLLENTDINYFAFLKGRIMQTIISVILIIIF